MAYALRYAHVGMERSPIAPGEGNHRLYSLKCLLPGQEKGCFKDVEHSILFLPYTHNLPQPHSGENVELLIAPLNCSSFQILYNCLAVL